MQRKSGGGFVFGAMGFSRKISNDDLRAPDSSPFNSWLQDMDMTAGRLLVRCHYATVKEKTLCNGKAYCWTDFRVTELTCN